ncbi:MAG: HAMP domain-containing histidine kinase, partial [Bdellovibrionales bacterium]|nr:HAMP domain-containing histidine kinase [Bdellovibrionales bacterium]
MPNSVLKQDLDKLYNVIADEAILAFLAFEKKSGKCLYLNKLARELFQLSLENPEENIQISNLFVNDQHDSIRSFNSELLEHEGLYQDVLIHKHSGHKFIGNIGVKEICYENYEIQLLMIQDITIQKKLQREITAKQVEIKSAYEELLKQNRQLKELDLAKNRFIALTTHELRTPLSAMIASAELLKLGLYDTDEERNEFITMIYDQGLHLSALVNDILDFAKIQAGKMDYYIQQGSPQKIIEEIIEGLEPMAEKDKIQLQLTTSQDLMSCYFDDVRLKQVVTNIITNAIKYNKSQGWVKIWLEKSEKEVTLYVEDSGKGIPEDQVSKVFDEFETLGKVSLHHQGTGLGMPISKRLIEGMGGSIHLKSEVGTGTKFWITIPIEKVLKE